MAVAEVIREIKKDKLQQLMMDLNALRPKRIDNQLVVK